MTTKEKIQVELERLDEQDMDQLLRVIEEIQAKPDPPQPHGFLARLREIKIDAPEDFAANLDGHRRRGREATVDCSP